MTPSINSLPVGWQTYPTYRLERWMEILDRESPLYDGLVEEVLKRRMFDHIVGILAPN